MRKIYFLAVLILTAWGTQAQFAVTTYDSSTMEPNGSINDGDVFAFNSTNYETSSIYFWIENNNAHDIYVRIVYDEIINANGVDFEFCFGGLCIFTVEEGVHYPEEGGPLLIPAGGKTVDFDHFLNRNEGNDTFPIDYKIRFFEVDAGDTPNGNEISFIYRYDPTMSVDGFNSVQANVQNTLVESELAIVAQEAVQLQVFDLQGKLINQTDLNMGYNSIELAGLHAGLYFGKLQNENGQSEIFKFVKK